MKSGRGANTRLMSRTKRSTEMRVGVTSTVGLLGEMLCYWVQMYAFTDLGNPSYPNFGVPKDGLQE
jgi:hypothetical protein